MSADSDADFLKLRRAVELGWLTPEQVESAIVESDRDRDGGLFRRVPLSPEQKEALERLMPAEAAEAMRDPANRVGGYIRVNLLGSGGMGRVFRAWDTKLSRWVALKLLRAGDDPRARARFRREAHLAAGVAHPGIAAVYEFGEDGGDPWIAMQFVEGHTVAEERGRGCPARRAAEIVRDAARAVAAAHAKGVIHRDLKPSNLMVDGSGRVFVLDFGLAKAGEDGASGGSAAGALLGTPEYMAPEQIQGGAAAAGPASDVYGLGACLYEIIAGNPPFRSESRGEAMIRAVRDDPPALPVAAARGLETVIRKCLEKRPEDRYPSAEALADDLDRFLRGEGVHARRRRRLGRWAKGGAAAVILGGLLWTLSRALAAPSIPAPELITDDPLLHAAFRLSADEHGLLVVSAAGEEQVRIVRVDPRSKHVRILHRIPEYVGAAAATPRGIAVMNHNSPPDTVTRIWLADGTTIYRGTPAKEPIVDGCSMAWADGRLLVSDQVGGGVTAVDPDGREPREICAPRYSGGFATEHSNAIAVSDGALFVADSGLTGVLPPQVVKLPHDGGAPVPVHVGAPLRRPQAVAAADGWVYVADPGAGNTVWRIPATGGVPVRVASGPPFVELAGVAVYGNALYILDGGNYQDGRGVIVDGPGAIYRIEIR